MSWYENFSSSPVFRSDLFRPLFGSFLCKHCSREALFQGEAETCAYGSKLSSILEGLAMGWLTSAHRDQELGWDLCRILYPCRNPLLYILPFQDLPSHTLFSLWWPLPLISVGPTLRARPQRKDKFINKWETHPTWPISLSFCSFTIYLLFFLSRVLEQLSFCSFVVQSFFIVISERDGL